MPSPIHTITLTLSAEELAGVLEAIYIGLTIMASAAGQPDSPSQQEVQAAAAVYRQLRKESFKC